MNMNNLNQGFSVKCGKTTDSFDELKMAQLHKSVAI